MLFFTLLCPQGVNSTDLPRKELLTCLHTKSLANSVQSVRFVLCYNVENKPPSADVEKGVPPGAYGDALVLHVPETRPPLHIDECWSQLREYLKVQFY
jgi:hypothetical protein